jgi:8-oxo-dGTP pyrophosphatase MutT (NUDIX family)
MTEDQAEAGRGSGDQPPKLAVSVILLRDAPGGLEVFVQHRVSTMDFAAGMVVFPGGRVDDVDSSGWTFSVDLLNAHVAAWAGTSVSKDASQARHNAGRLLAAAVREVAEECGITLVQSSLIPWANWVTPEGQPRRFDTYFFVSAAGPGVEPRHETTEAWQSQWLPVRQIVEDEAAGVLRLLPPTLAILDELLDLGAVVPILQSKRTIKSVRPRPGDMEEYFRLRRLGEKWDMSTPRPTQS